MKFTDFAGNSKKSLTPLRQARETYVCVNLLRKRNIPNWEANSAQFTPYAMNERTIFSREFRCQK